MHKFFTSSLNFVFPHDRVFLIGSVPGRHVGESRNSFGHLKLRKVMTCACIFPYPETKVPDCSVQYVLTAIVTFHVDSALCWTSQWCEELATCWSVLQHWVFGSQSRFMGHFRAAHELVDYIWRPCAFAETTPSPCEPQFFSCNLNLWIIVIYKVLSASLQKKKNHAPNSLCPNALECVCICETTAFGSCIKFSSKYCLLPSISQWKGLLSVHTIRVQIQKCIRFCIHKQGNQFIITFCLFLFLIFFFENTYFICILRYIQSPEKSAAISLGNK